MIDLSFTNEELNALEFYINGRYKAINQMLISDCESDIALLSDETEGKSVEISYNRALVIEYLMNMKLIYKLILKACYKSPRKRVKLYRGTNLAEVERVRNEVYIDKFLIASDNKEKAEERFASNWNRPASMNIILDDNIPYIFVDDILENSNGTNTVIISAFTKIKKATESLERQLDNNSKYLKTYNIELEKQELDPLTDKERNGLYTYILENAYCINKKIEDCIRLEKENAVNFENIRKLEQLLAKYENAIEEKENREDYSDIERENDYSDIARVNRELEEIKKISTDIFELRKQNIDFVNLWKRNIAVYMIAECKEIEKLFEGLEFPGLEKEKIEEVKENKIDNELEDVESKILVTAGVGINGAENKLESKMNDIENITEGLLDSAGIKSVNNEESKKDNIESELADNTENKIFNIENKLISDKDSEVIEINSKETNTDNELVGDEESKITNIDNELVSNEESKITNINNELVGNEESKITNIDNKLVDNEENKITNIDNKLVANEENEITNTDNELVGNEENKITNINNELVGNEENEITNTDNELVGNEENKITNINNELVGNEENEIANIDNELVGNEENKITNTDNELVGNVESKITDIENKLLSDGSNKVARMANELSSNEESKISNIEKNLKEINNIEDFRETKVVPILQIKEENKNSENPLYIRVKEEAKENIEAGEKLLENIENLIAKQQNHAKIAGNIGSFYSALNNAFDMRKAVESLIELLRNINLKVKVICEQEESPEIEEKLEKISKVNIEISTLINYANNPRIAVGNSKASRFDEMAIIEENELKRGIAEKIREIRGEAELKKLKDDLEIIEDKGTFSRIIGLITGRNKLDDLMIDQIEIRQKAIRRTLSKKLSLAKNYSIHELMAEIVMFINENEDDELVKNDIEQLEKIAEELRRNYLVLESKVQSIVEEKEANNLPLEDRKISKQELIEIETYRFLNRYGYDLSNNDKEEPKYQDTMASEIGRIIEYINSSNIM